MDDKQKKAELTQVCQEAIAVYLKTTRGAQYFGRTEITLPRKNCIQISSKSDVLRYYEIIIKEAF